MRNKILLVFPWIIAAAFFGFSAFTWHSYVQLKDETVVLKATNKEMLNYTKRIIQGRCPSGR